MYFINLYKHTSVDDYSHIKSVVWYGNILFDIVHIVIESILTKHNET